MQMDADMSADGRWLSYDQLARLRRIDKPSAIRLAARKSWRRRKGNTGQMQVLVPLDWFDRAQDRRDRYADMSADGVDVPALLAAIEAAHAGEVGALKGQIDALTTMASATGARLVDLDAEAAALRSRLADAETRADRAATEAREAREAAEALRAAESTWWARGRWRRVLAAWRGG
jgi:hypothetical protein